MADIRLVDKVTPPPPSPPKLLTRADLDFTYKGPYPKHGIILATGGFMMRGSSWLVADLDERKFQCILIPDVRLQPSFGPTLSKGEISATLSANDIGQLRRALSDAEGGKDPGQRMTGHVADRTINSTAVFDGDRVLLAEDDRLYLGFPKLAALMSAIQRAECSGRKPVSTPLSASELH